MQSVVCRLQEDQLSQGPLERKGQTRRRSCMCQVSANQTTLELVASQPPTPTVSPSAQASAAAMQLRQGGSAKKADGEKDSVASSQVRQFLLSFWRVVVLL